MKLYSITNHLLKKLAGASLSISVLLVFIFVQNGGNMLEFHELITNPTVWALFFGYGIISSIIIDFIDKPMIPNNTSIKQILLYILFGYLPFVVWMPLEVSLFIGAIGVGAFFSLLFTWKNLNHLSGIAGLCSSSQLLVY